MPVPVPVPDWKPGAVLLAAVLVACGGGSRPAGKVAASAHAHLVTAGDPLIALLPDGAQVVVEVDLARLRANPVIGELATTALAGNLALPANVPASPLRDARVLVLAAYGVGTSDAATITLLATDAPPAEPARAIAPGVIGLGPEAWLDQVVARAAIVHVAASPELLALRDHAMPAGAPGAAVRVTARLPFDARVALARTAGLDDAPAQLSLWADVVDDVALVVDADGSDPGDGAAPKARERTGRAMATALRGALASLAREPGARALGVVASLEGARVVTTGAWARAIVAVGPAHLKRVVARAREVLAPRNAAPAAVPSP